MKRNPYFKEWSKDAQPAGYPDQITQSYGLTVESQITAIENGQADWTLEAPPADRLNELGTKYASQTHVETLTAFWYAPMNVNLAPFNNLKARQAVNYAIDRNALVKIFGGPKLAVPSCQVLPPGFPGNKPYCPYTKNPGTTWSAPDVAKAKKLVQESGTKGAKVVVISPDDEVQKAVGVYLASVLNQIGFKATVEDDLGEHLRSPTRRTRRTRCRSTCSSGTRTTRLHRTSCNILFGCESFHPGSDSSINMAGFCDKPINAQMQQALKLEQTNFPAANALWAKIDQQVTDAGADGDAVHAAPHRLRVEARRELRRSASSSTGWSTSPGCSSRRPERSVSGAVVGEVPAAERVTSPRSPSGPWQLARRRLLRNRIALAMAALLAPDRRRSACARRCTRTTSRTPIRSGRTSTARRS